MPGFIIRLLITAAGLWLAAAIVPGMEINSAGTLFLAAILLGLVNAIIRPIVFVLTLPFSIITLGFFILVINAAMLGLVAAMLDDFALSGFLSALMGSIIVGLVSWWASWYIGPDGKFEVLIINKR